MPRPLGDFNNDGVVDSRDGAALSTYVEKLRKAEPIDPPATAEDIWAGDVLKFGSLHMFDAKTLLKIYSYMSHKLYGSPKEQPPQWDTVYTKFYYTTPTGERVKMTVEQFPTAPPFQEGETGYVGPYWIDFDYLYSVFNNDITPYLAQMP